MEYKEIYKICHLLAVKKDPELKKDKNDVWLQYIHDTGSYQCLICNKIICSVDKDIYPLDKCKDHGLDHIKENNLLVFI